MAWYGRLVGDSRSRCIPSIPVDLAGSLNAPVLGLYGGADTGIPQESVEQMRAAVKAAGKTAEIVVYPDTPHAFFADYRPQLSGRAGRRWLETDARVVSQQWRGMTPGLPFPRFRITPPMNISALLPCCLLCACCDLLAAGHRYGRTSRRRPAKSPREN